jgi:hypothetical protein
MPIFFSEDNIRAVLLKYTFVLLQTVINMDHFCNKQISKNFKSDQLLKNQKNTFFPKENASIDRL